MIRNHVTKSTHGGLNILSIGVFDAITHFNYGSTSYFRSPEGIKC